MPSGFGRHLYAVTATQLTGYLNVSFLVNNIVLHARY